MLDGEHENFSSERDGLHVRSDVEADHFLPACTDCGECAGLAPALIRQEGLHGRVQSVLALTGTGRPTHVSTPSASLRTLAG